MHLHCDVEYMRLGKSMNTNIISAPSDAAGKTDKRKFDLFAADLRTSFVGEQTPSRKSIVVPPRFHSLWLQLAQNIVFFSLGFFASGVKCPVVECFM